MEIPSFLLQDSKHTERIWPLPMGSAFFFFFLSCKLVHVFYEVLMQLVSNVPNLCNWIFHKWAFCMQAFVHINIYASIQINARASVCLCDKNMHMHEHLYQGISPQS